MKSTKTKGAMQKTPNKTGAIMDPAGANELSAAFY